MKRISKPDLWILKKHGSFSLLLLTALTLTTSSCQDDDMHDFDYATLEDGIPGDVCYFTNPPYPADADTLRILAIGSSFTNDATSYLDTLIKASGIDTQRLGIYKVVMPFARFNTWVDIWKRQESLYLQQIGGDVKMKSYGSLQDVLSQAWDVIVLSQASDASYQWSTFASLKEYMEIVCNACPNRKVCFAYQLQWSHTPKEMPYVMQGNVACCEKMSQRYGIDVIIPCGTSIQIARGTALNDSRYLTRDNYHLNLGMGCYIASCTWFQKLLYPVFGCSVVGNQARPDGNYRQDEILLGQRCAEYAVDHPYDFTYTLID